MTSSTVEVAEYPRGLTLGSSVAVWWAMPSPFELLKTDTVTAARRGRLRTRHGVIETPIFMPVGTQGTVKSLTPAHLKEIGSQIILGNTYHLNLRPGSELVKELGGLHGFMGWDGPILTDSGGFQVFSLAKLRKMHDDGVEFQSHLDGKKCFLGPREVMGIQQNLGSDIAMVIDECPPWPCSREDTAAACERSLRWAGQCKRIATDSGFLANGHHVFAIVQGSTYDDLRREAAALINTWNKCVLLLCVRAREGGGYRRRQQLGCGRGGKAHSRVRSTANRCAPVSHYCHPRPHASHSVSVPRMCTASSRHTWACHCQR